MAILRIPITTITEPAEGTCDDCGFDALRRLRGYHLSTNGVQHLFDITKCGRCAAEERRTGGE